MGEAFPQVDVAYQQCRHITRRAAKNFYYAFITLPPRKRKAVYATYAFCRLCDDASDGEIPTEEKLRLLAELREKLSMAYGGRPSGPVFTALAHASSAFGIPEEYLQEVVSGVEMDLTRSRYRNFEELRTYCYRVASVVGLICIQIFGYSDARAKEHAIDLGLAMQLTNILRDIKEDLGRDRVYLPLDELGHFGCSVEQLEAGVSDEAFQELMRFQATRTRKYFESGFKLLPFLSPRSRACPAVLGQLYSAILGRIESSDFNVFDGRLSLSRSEKCLVTARTWMRSLLPMSLRA